MVGMFVLGLLGFAIAVGLQKLEVRLMPWQQRGMRPQCLTRARDRPRRP
jgi:hypothetical protein